MHAYETGNFRTAWKYLTAIKYTHTLGLVHQLARATTLVGAIVNTHFLNIWHKGSLSIITIIITPLLLFLLSSSFPSLVPKLIYSAVATWYSPSP